MEFLPPLLEKYVLEHTQEELPILKELSRQTHLKVNKPRMLSGHLQGVFLQMISKLMRPKRILEIGTYTGYSAICLAQGLSEDGILHTLDNNPENEKITKTYFDKAGFGQQIKFHLGKAEETLPHLLTENEEWDLVFIDADKINYAKYYDLVFDKVRSGGLIIADNVLWSGKVLTTPKDKDKDTKALISFNQKVHQDSASEHILLPLRDGLMMAMKK